MYLTFLSASKSVIWYTRRGGSNEIILHERDISYLSHLFTVGLGIQGGFRQKNWVLFRCNTQFVVEGVVPDLLHVVPVGDDTVLNGVLQSQDTLNCQNADTMSKILS